MSKDPCVPPASPAPLPREAWSQDLEWYLTFLEKQRERDGGLRFGPGALAPSPLEGWAWMDETFRQWMIASRTGLLGVDVNGLSRFLRTVLLRCWLGFNASPPPPEDRPRVLWINTAQSPMDFCASWVHGLARLQSPDAWSGATEAAQADALALAAAELREVPLLPAHVPGLRPVELVERAADAATEAGINTLVVDGLSDAARGGRSILWGEGAGEFHRALRYLARVFGLRVFLLLPTGGPLPGHREAGGWAEDSGLCLTHLMVVQPLDQERTGVRVEMQADRYRPSGGATLVWKDALRGRTT